MRSKRWFYVSGKHWASGTMNQMLERMCNLSSCCVSSREREREHDLRFERRWCFDVGHDYYKIPAHILPVSPSPFRTGENNRRGAGETYSDYNFDPSAMSQVAAIAKFIQHTVRTSVLKKLAHSHTLAQNTVFKTQGHSQ